MTKQEVSQIFNSVPTSLLEQIGIATKVDYNVSRLYGDRMFKLLVYAMIRSEKISTRILAQLYNSAFFSAFSGKGGHQTRHSSLADRLRSMKAEYFEQIFHWAASHYGKTLSGKGLFKKVRRFDSTMVAISSALVSWGMRVGCPPKKGFPKVQLKFTLEMYADLPVGVRSFFDQAHLSEEKALKEAILSAGIKPGDIVVFDNGLKSRLTFKTFDQQGIYFVSRGAVNSKYQVLEDHRKIKNRKADGLRFLQDSKVYLYTDGAKQVEHPFRLIEVEDIQTGERIIFVTNIWNLSAMDVARAYKFRWDIEVFFRFVKQHLGIKHLISRSENGVKIQLYTALITAIFLLVFKITNKLSSYAIAKLKFEDDLLLLLFNELSKKTPP